MKANISTLVNWWTRYSPLLARPAAPASVRKQCERPTYFNGSTDTYEPIFGAHNSIRIPPFVSLDARLAKRFKLGAREEAEVYLDVQNVTNHANPEEIVYNASYTQKGYITGLPVLPSLGLRFSW